jgi:hypothetical protein
MAQAYSNAQRESDPHALPNVEIFAVSPLDANYSAPLSRTERVTRQAQWDDQQHQSDAQVA